jgi:hypothetical protein
MSIKQTKINPVVALVAWLIAGTLLTVMAVVIGVTILGVGTAHAAGTHPTASYAVFAQRGHGGHR